MIIFVKQKLVILENTKTATTSFEDFLKRNNLWINTRPKKDCVSLTIKEFDNHINSHKNLEKAFFGRKHINYRDYNDNYKSHTSLFETFSLVRNPLDWAVSWWRMLQYHNRVGPFETFIESFTKTQTEFFLPGEGTLPIDHIFQYEQLPLAINFLQDKLGFNINLERCNTYNRIKKPDISNELIEKFKATFLNEYKLWSSAYR